MERPILRNMLPTDSSSVVALNKAAVDVTSPMDGERFSYLFGLADMKLAAETDGDVVGFVMAMTDSAGYDNGNYRWFSERLRNFMYIDRVVVSAACRGRGIGQLLYSLAIELAVQLGTLNMCAEMDLDPPNHGSLRFHKATGFVEIGTRVLDSGKRVSMQILPVNASAKIV